MKCKKTCGHCELYLHCLHWGKEIEKETPGCEDWEVSFAEFQEMTDEEIEEIKELKKK